ncbi:MAG: hypothetical protein H8F28_10880 [Fibrella sp.]|nr:hypothetical protein [Armatimonadota bacterium]
MPTLTLDLPESAYRAALDLPPAERVRRAAAAFTDETETAKHQRILDKCPMLSLYTSCTLSQ